MRWDKLAGRIFEAAIPSLLASALMLGAGYFVMRRELDDARGDIQEIQGKLTTVAEDVAWIKGTMKSESASARESQTHQTKTPEASPQTGESLAGHAATSAAESPDEGDVLPEESHDTSPRWSVWELSEEALADLVPEQ